MYRVINLLVGFMGAIAGIIMALGLWHSTKELPPLGEWITRPLGSFVIVAFIAFMQSKKDVKKMSQYGIAVGFLWTITAMLLELSL